MQTRLIDGSGGAFEVRYGDELIFSKLKEHRFPEPAEIIEAINSKK